MSARTEIPLSHFPEGDHPPLVRPFKRLPDEIINKYSGLTGGKDQLFYMTPLSKLDLCQFVVLTKDGEARKLDLMYVGEPDRNNHWKIQLGAQRFENGSCSEVRDVWVDPDNLQTETTGITEEMFQASERASKAFLADYVKRLVKGFQLSFEGKLSPNRQVRNMIITTADELREVEKRIKNPFAPLEQ